MKRKILILFLVLVVIMCCSMSIWIRNWDPGTSRFSDPDLLATNADFTLPDSARNVEGYFSGFNNFVMYGKFDMDVADLDDFEANANCDEPFRPIDPNSSYLEYPQFRWWKPSSESLICFGEGGGCGKTLIIDTADFETYTVYVHAGCG